MGEQTRARWQSSQVSRPIPGLLSCHMLPCHAFSCLLHAAFARSDACHIATQEEAAGMSQRMEDTWAREC